MQQPEKCGAACGQEGWMTGQYSPTPKTEQHSHCHTIRKEIGEAQKALQHFIEASSAVQVESGQPILSDQKENPLHAPIQDLLRTLNGHSSEQPGQ